jgi:hypothetical protein
MRRQHKTNSKYSHSDYELSDESLFLSPRPVKINNSGKECYLFTRQEMYKAIVRLRYKKYLHKRGLYSTGLRTVEELRALAISAAAIRAMNPPKPEGAP